MHPSTNTVGIRYSVRVLEEFEAEKLAQRRANAEAKARGAPLPHPNVWDALDPTKIPEDADEEAYAESVRAFTKLCPPKKPRRL